MGVQEFEAVGDQTNGLVCLELSQLSFFFSWLPSFLTPSLACVLALLETGSYHVA